MQLEVKKLLLLLFRLKSGYLSEKLRRAYGVVWVIYKQHNSGVAVFVFLHLHFFLYVGFYTSNWKPSVLPPLHTCPHIIPRVMSKHPTKDRAGKWRGVSNGERATIFQGKEKETETEKYRNKTMAKFRSGVAYRWFGRTAW